MVRSIILLAVTWLYCQNQWVGDLQGKRFISKELHSERYVNLLFVDQHNFTLDIGHLGVVWNLSGSYRIVDDSIFLNYQAPDALDVRLSYSQRSFDSCHMKESALLGAAVDTKGNILIDALFYFENNQPYGVSPFFEPCQLLARNQTDSFRLVYLGLQYSKWIHNALKKDSVCNPVIYSNLSKQVQSQIPHIDKLLVGLTRDTLYFMTDKNVAYQSIYIKSRDK
ncbi:MAG: hypothetical protein RL660_2521 [Bacteroidota bacterium]|jgi:hypothetical protein